MTTHIESLAIAESMELLTKIVTDAEQECSYAFERYELAQAELRHWRNRKQAFIDCMKEQTP